MLESETKSMCPFTKLCFGSFYQPPWERGSCWAASHGVETKWCDREVRVFELLQVLLILDTQQ